MPHKCHGHEEPNGNPAVSWLVVEASINTTERKTWSNKEAKLCTNSRYRIPPGKTDGIMSQAATRTRGGPINVEPPSMRGERVSGVTMSSSVVGGQTGLKHVAHIYAVVETTSGRRNQQRILVPKGQPRKEHDEYI